VLLHMSRPMTTQVSEPGETPDAVLLGSYQMFSFSAERA